MRQTCVTAALAALAALPVSGASARPDVAAAAEPASATLSGTITSRSDGRPLPGARVTIPSLKLSAMSDAEGRYVIAVPLSAVGTQAVEVLASFAGLQPQTSTATFERGSLALDFALPIGFHEDVTVGSRAPGAESEKAVPVDVYTARQIATTGASETGQILETLSPSVNFPRTSISDGADTVRPATLRGLGPDQVLVLVDGKRRHTTAHIVTSGVIGRGTTGVDLNAIPASAVDKVEVLRDGASAQYGSDAIAGVVDFELKTGEQPLTLTAKGGSTLGDFTDLAGAARDFHDGALTEATVSRGFAVGRGSVFVTGEYRNRNGTNRASPDPRDQIVAGDGGHNAVAEPNHHWGDSEERDILTFVNASIPLDADQSRTFYAFGGWSRRDGSHGGFYRRALDARNWPQIYPLGYLPTEQPEVLDGAGTVGVRGQSRSWFWDASAQYGRNSIDFDVVNSLNVSLGPNSTQRSFYSGSLVFDQEMVNVDLAHQMRLGLAGPVNLALGAEYRRERFQELPGEPASYENGGFANQFGGPAEAGVQVFPGFRPTNAADAARNSGAVYADLEGDVVSRVRLGVAGRFEHYDDFGDTLNGKLTLRVAPLEHVVLRGAASTGFRAPSLAQSHFSSVATNFITVAGVVQPVEVGTFAVDNPVARAMGAQDLKPEKSVNLSAGVVVSPIPAFTASVDYYRIRIDDRVVFSGNFTGPAIEALVRPFGANGGRFFTNAIDTKTQGVDVSASYDRGLGAAGRLALTAAYNHTSNAIVGSIATPPQLAGLENVLFDRTETERLTCGQPSSNARLSADWTRGRLGATLRASRYGTYCFATSTPANDQTFGAKWLGDLEVSYTRGKWTLAAGADNVFDVFPDRLLAVNSSFQVQTYPATSPFGFNGRFLYSRLVVRF